MIEVTNTFTKVPKLTIAKGRVALKFNFEFPAEERAPYFRYAELIAKKVGEPKLTLRGKFHLDGDGSLKGITLKNRESRIQVSFAEGEIETDGIQNIQTQPEPKSTISKG